MKKTLYLTILTIVTVICIIAGSCYHLVGWGQHLLHYVPFISFSNDNGDHSQTSSQKTEEVGPFTTLDIDVNVLDVTVTTGSTYSVSYNCSDRIIPTYEVDNGVLTIRQPNDNSWNWGYNHCELTVTIPELTDFNNFKIQSNVGDINVENIKCNDGFIDANVGDITLRNIDVATNDYSSSTGDVKVEVSSFNTMKIDSSVGDIDIDSKIDLSDYRMDLSTSVGDVTVNGKDKDDEYSTKGLSNDAFLTVDASTGDITVRYK